jgi:hypothetical protein
MTSKRPPVRGSKAGWVALAVGIIVAALTLHISGRYQYPAGGQTISIVTVSVYHLIGFQFGGPDWGPYIPVSWLNPL